MSAARKLYRLAVRCPRCGAPPRLRLTALQISKWQEDDPGEMVQTYQCSWELQPGRACNTIYAITARAVQRAEEV